MELTAYQVQQMKEQQERFYLLNDEPECTNVIFWYVPERLRPKQCPQYGTRDWQLELGNVSSDWRRAMRRLNAVNSLCAYPCFKRRNGDRNLKHDGQTGRQCFWCLVSLREV